jgi:hypothetical protein
MSRKTISFQNAPKNPATPDTAPAPKKRAVARSRKAAAIDEWVNDAPEAPQDALLQVSEPTPALEASVEAAATVEAVVETPAASAPNVEPPPIQSDVAPKIAPGPSAAPQAVFSLSAQPDPFEAFKVLFLLPYLACFYWSFGAARKNMGFWVR